MPSGLIVFLVVAALFVLLLLHERAVKAARADEAGKWQRWLEASDAKLKEALAWQSTRSQEAWHAAQAAHFAERAKAGAVGEAHPYAHVEGRAICDGQRGPGKG